MEKVRYMIGDAAGRLQVEAHVLRYWEEELDLKVPRNELGHRYYTEENLKQFEEIKRLKEEGFQLKAIKMLIHNRPTVTSEDIRMGELCVGAQPKAEESKKKDSMDRDRMPDNGSCLAQENQSLCEMQAAVKSGEASDRETSDGKGDENKEICALSEQQPETAVEAPAAPLSKLEQFQLMMNEIVRGAIAENNQALGQEIGERVLKEMNYLMRDREEQEEERFRKLDETIRTHQRRLRRAKTTRKKEKTKKIGLRTGESMS